MERFCPMRGRSVEGVLKPYLLIDCATPLCPQQIDGLGVPSSAEVGGVHPDLWSGIDPLSLLYDAKGGLADKAAARWKIFAVHVARGTTTLDSFVDCKGDALLLRAWLTSQ